MLCGASSEGQTELSPVRIEGTLFGHTPHPVRVEIDGETCTNPTWLSGGEISCELPTDGSTRIGKDIPVSVNVANTTLEGIAADLDCRPGTCVTRPAPRPCACVSAEAPLPPLHLQISRRGGEEPTGTRVRSARIR